MHVNVKYTGVYIVILQCLANTKALFKTAVCTTCSYYSFQSTDRNRSHLHAFIQALLTHHRLAGGEVVNCLTCAFEGTPVMQVSLGSCCDRAISGFLCVPLPPFFTEM